MCAALRDVVGEYLGRAVPQGERNRSLYVAACAAYRQGADEQDIFSRLSPKAMSDGLKGMEIQATIKSAVKSARADGHPRPRADKIVAWDAALPYSAKEAEKHQIPDPAEDWEFADLPRFLASLFSNDEFVAFNTATKTTEDRTVPSGWGTFNKTRTELQALFTDQRASEALHATEHGAWIRLNPMDGKGIKDENVTAFRHCLVESDTLPLHEQWGIVNRLRLPVSTCVHSGNKSLHFAVKIQACDRLEYDSRVSLLYTHLESAGMKIDTQNKNPSRLSRLPGVFRGEKPQYLVATNFGCASWTEFEKTLTAAPAIELWMPSDVSLWIAQDAPARNWVLKNMLAVGEVGSIFAAGSTGKTWLLEELGISAGCGRPFFSFGFPTKPIRVTMFIGEDDEIATWARFRAIFKHFEITDEEFALIRSNLRIFCGVSEPLLTLRYGVPERTPRFEWMKREVETCDLLIIDCKARFDATDENRANDSTAFLVAIQDLVRGKGAALVAHHIAKAQTGELTAEAGRGSTAFKDGCRWVGVLAGLSETELRNFDLDEHTHRYLKFDCPKANHSPALPQIIYLERNPQGVLFLVDLAASRIDRIAGFLATWLVDVEGGISLRDLQRNKGDSAKVFRQVLKDEVPKPKKVEILAGIERAVTNGLVLVNTGERGIATLISRREEGVF